LVVLRISNGQITGIQTRSRVNFGFPGGQPIVTSDGQNNSIVWDVQVDNFRGPGAATLRAYDLTTATPTTELYNSNAVSLRDQAGGSVKFIPATVTNGKVLVGGVNNFSIYGTFGDHPSAPAARLDLTGSGPEGGTFVTLTWTNPDALANQIAIERGTNV